MRHADWRIKTLKKMLDQERPGTMYKKAKTIIYDFRQDPIGKHINYGVSALGAVDVGRVLNASAKAHRKILPLFGRLLLNPHSPFERIMSLSDEQIRNIVTRELGEKGIGVSIGTPIGVLTKKYIKNEGIYPLYLNLLAHTSGYPPGAYFYAGFPLKYILKKPETIMLANRFTPTLYHELGHAKNRKNAILPIRISPYKQTTLLEESLASYRALRNLKRDFGNKGVIVGLPVLGTAFGTYLKALPNDVPLTKGRYMSEVRRMARGSNHRRAIANYIRKSEQTFDTFYKMNKITRPTVNIVNNIAHGISARDLSTAQTTSLALLSSILANPKKIDIGRSALQTASFLAGNLYGKHKYSTNKSILDKLKALL